MRYVKVAAVAVDSEPFIRIVKGENGVSLTRIASDSTRLEYSPMDGNPGYVVILDPKTGEPRLSEKSLSSG